jgi:Flp pilus assembly protein TadB
MAMLGSGFIYPDLVLQKEAGRRRKSFRYGFSSFLDLVTVLLAGGSGIESALLMASETGDGQTFEQIRKSLRRSQVARTSPWDELADLGRRFGIDEIVEVAGSVELAGRHGARIRDTLVARAATLRHRQLSEIEAEAAAATERMGMPMVLLFIGFISLVGYPAVVEMLQGW